jgi:hypothetical protein
MSLVNIVGVAQKYCCYLQFQVEVREEWAESVEIAEHKMEIKANPTQLHLPCIKNCETFPCQNLSAPFSVALSFKLCHLHTNFLTKAALSH